VGNVFAVADHTFSRSAVLHSEWTLWASGNPLLGAGGKGRSGSQYCENGPTWRRVIGLNQALGSTTEDRVLEASPDKAGPSAWFDHGGKEAESWCKRSESLLGGDRRPGGTPRFLLVELL